MSDPVHVVELPELETRVNENVGEATISNARHVNMRALFLSISDSSQSLHIPSLQDSYLTLFFSSKQAQQIMIPKYVCNFLTVMLLMMKFSDNYSNLTWGLVSLPSFFSNFLSFSAKFSEIYYLLKVREMSLLAPLRQYAVVIDLLGSIYFKGILLGYLQSNMEIQNILPYSIPFWLFLAVSIGLRVWNQQVHANFNPSSRIPSTNLTKQEVLNWLAITVLFLERGIQLLLIGLKLNNELSVSTRWSIVFGPCWAILFFTMSCAILLISFSPFISSMTTGSAVLKEITVVLVYLIAFQLALGSICSIAFLVLLTKRLDYEYSNHAYGEEISTHSILAPLLVLFLILSLFNPIFLRFASKYQVGKFSSLPFSFFLPLF